MNCWFSSHYWCNKKRSWVCGAHLPLFLTSALSVPAYFWRIQRRIAHFSFQPTRSICCPDVNSDWSSVVKLHLQRSREMCVYADFYFENLKRFNVKSIWAECASCSTNWFIAAYHDCGWNHFWNGLFKSWPMHDLTHGSTSIHICHSFSSLAAHFEHLLQHYVYPSSFHGHYLHDWQHYFGWQVLADFWNSSDQIDWRRLG